jgi:PIN domain nuclease of toxin-antitoxin system
VYLLDTHAIVWAIGSPEHLSAKIRDIIESGQTVVSAVSLWELIVKSSRKDAPVVRPTEWWERYIGRQGIEVLPIRVKHLEHLELLPKIHKDPFDRLLICQAVTEELTLVTCDAEIQRYGVDTTW